jgi:hypothetical protein
MQDGKSLSRRPTSLYQAESRYKHGQDEQVFILRFH